MRVVTKLALFLSKNILNSILVTRKIERFINKLFHERAMSYLKQVQLINTNRELRHYFTQESMDSIHGESQETMAIEINALQEIYDEISQFRRYRELNNRHIKELQNELKETRAKLEELKRQRISFKQEAEKVPKEAQPAREESNIEPSSSDFNKESVAVEEIFNFSGKRG